MRIHVADLSVLAGAAVFLAALWRINFELFLLGAALLLVLAGLLGERFVAHVKSKAKR